MLTSTACSLVNSNNLDILYLSTGTVRRNECNFVNGLIEIVMAYFSAPWLIRFMNMFMYSYDYILYICKLEIYSSGHTVMRESIKGTTEEDHPLFGS